MATVEIWQWALVIGTSLILLLISPLSKTKGEFFQAIGRKFRQPGPIVLTSSLVISWIFAKSITNAANLGAAYGITGGVAYGAYYLSFLVAGIVIYRMRTQGGFKSIHEFLGSRYGKAAVGLFSLLIAFRLMNEVWSNTMVIGSYFGDMGSLKYYLAILVFTLLTLAYVLKGGLRSSLLTDMVQMVLFGVLLVVVLGMIIPANDYSASDYVNSGDWGWGGGINLLLLALVQVFSYPFHDPVMTDRAFISDPKVTLRSFVWATAIGFVCIVLFSLVGVYAKFEGMEGQAPVIVSRSLGTVMMLVMNLIMVTSAASTLDSSFASVSKLFVLDLGAFKAMPVSGGRLIMVAAALVGTIPVFLGAEILSATTISGTMVMGLAPIFLFWKMKAPPLSFFLSVCMGIAIGIVVAFGIYPEELIFFEGKYGDVLSANMIGTGLCILLFLIPATFKTNGSKLENT